MFFCQNLGGNLVSITSAKENSFVWYNFVRDKAHTYLGAKVATSSGTTSATSRSWEWQDSSAWTFANWASSASGGNAGISLGHDCVHLKKTDDQQWDDVNCAGSKPYVCKK